MMEQEEEQEKKTKREKEKKKREREKEKTNVMQFRRVDFGFYWSILCSVVSSHWLTKEMKWIINGPNKKKKKKKEGIKNIKQKVKKKKNDMCAHES